MVASFVAVVGHWYSSVQSRGGWRADQGGTLGLFEGPNGLRQLFGQTIDMNLADSSLDVVQQTYLKKYRSLIHGQPVIETVLHLAREHVLDHRDVTSVRLEVFQSAYDIAGAERSATRQAVDQGTGGLQADYNLKYLTAAALIDGQVGPDQLREDRIRGGDVQDLSQRVEVSADDELTTRVSAHHPGPGAHRTPQR